ncbi:MAG: hypothetical protein FJW20_23480 [Acidimicrobiia bacterium]|nr:hypothetical protein [Acidimicrobiia bacterium]
MHADQLHRYVEKFGNRVWVCLYDDFKIRPLAILQSAFRFLGVEAGFQPDTQKRDLEAQVPRFPLVGRLKRWGVWETAAGLTPPALRPTIRRALVRKPGTVQMEAADRQFLVDYYRDDVWNLSAQLGRDLTAWLDSRTPR